MRKKIIAVILLVAISSSHIFAQSVYNLGKTIKDNCRDINFESSVGWYNHPSYFISASIENDYLILSYSKHETVVTKERPVYHEENVTHSVKINLLKLASVTSANIRVTDHNSFTYGVRFNTFDRVVISQDKSQSKGPSTSDLFSYTISCRTAAVQKQLLEAVKRCTENYTHRVPRNESEVSDCFNELSDLLKTYKISRVAVSNNGWSNKRVIDVNNFRVSYKNGMLNMSFSTFDCKDCYGRKKLSVNLMLPVRDLQCYAYSTYTTGANLVIESSEGFKRTENGDNTIINKYFFCADEAVCKKICHTINALIDGINTVSSVKDLGSQSSKPKQKKATNSLQKKISNSFGQ